MIYFTHWQQKTYLQIIYNTVADIPLMLFTRNLKVDHDWRIQIDIYHTNSKNRVGLWTNPKKINCFEFNKSLLLTNNIQRSLSYLQLIPFLVTNYSNKTYDYFLNKLSFLPESIVHSLIDLCKVKFFDFPTKEYQNAYPIIKQMQRFLTDIELTWYKKSARERIF
jgi:hypothetical protein